MTGLNALVSAIDLVVSIAFAISVFRQYGSRRKMHQLMWGVAIAIWAIAVAAELAATLRGRWGLITYPTYYATGALLIPAWLGMGTLYLVFPRRVNDAILVVLFVLSAAGIFLIASTAIPASKLYASPAVEVPRGLFPMIPTELIFIVLNTFGALAFVGGALWSAGTFAFKKDNKERAIATGLIAIGGLIAAVAHAAGVLAGIELFRISELAAVLFIFAGYLLSNAPAPQPAKAATRTAST